MFHKLQTADNSSFVHIGKISSKVVRTLKST